MPPRTAEIFHAGLMNAGLPKREWQQRSARQECQRLRGAILSAVKAVREQRRFHRLIPPSTAKKAEPGGALK